MAQEFSTVGCVRVWVEVKTTPDVRHAMQRDGRKVQAPEQTFRCLAGRVSSSNTILKFHDNQ